MGTEPDPFISRAVRQSHLDVQETLTSTTWVIPESRWSDFWGIIWTGFSLGMVIWFVGEADALGWDLSRLQWENESGELSGPIGNVFHSLFFLVLASAFSVFGLVWLCKDAFTTQHLLIVEHEPEGGVVEQRRRVLLPDRTKRRPRSLVRSVEVVDDSEGGDPTVQINFKYGEIKVWTAKPEELRPIAIRLAETLDVAVVSS